jgi:hypothetical protein
MGTKPGREMLSERKLDETFKKETAANSWLWSRAVIESFLIAKEVSNNLRSQTMELFSNFS